MNHIFDHLKLAGVNAGSWVATVGSIAYAKDILQIACLVASIIVSSYSVWWIRKQAKIADAKARNTQ
tara:strand:- start:343 stop:543 length:201 start_codon:yes stop_codon:yes gene_type:complete